MPLTIVSGGQSGVDRAALEFAASTGLPHRGWCPRDRWAEDGAIPDQFHLRETESGDPAVRTMLNVLDCDGVLIVRRKGAESGGSDLTHWFARLLNRPLLAVEDDADSTEAAEEIARWIESSGIAVLDVAGPRESEAPGIREFVKAVLATVAQAY